MTDISMGDLLSKEQGSAARANAGKTEWAYMPLHQVGRLRTLTREASAREVRPIELLCCLADIQAEGKYSVIMNAMCCATLFLQQEFSLTFEDAMRSVIDIWKMGETKYARFNWMKGMPWSEALNSAVRHTMSIMDGVAYDDESELPHAAHLICNLMMLAHYVVYYPEGNDLPSEWFDR